MSEINQIEKIPPQSLDAEMSLLGSILIDKEAIYRIADIVNPDDFYKTAHSKIYETILDLYAHNDPIDLLTLSNRLNEKNLLDLINKMVRNLQKYRNNALRAKELIHPDAAKHIVDLINQTVHET